MTTLAASVVICTRNRARALERSLATMLRLTIPPDLAWEILVVDNGSTDDTPAVAASFAGRLPLRLINVPVPGLSRGRNAGIGAARGDFILVTDDDCHVAADWVTTAVRLLAVDPMQLIGGRIELHNPDDVPLSVRTTPYRDVFDGTAAIWGFIHGANLATSCAVFDRIGGFDQALGAGSANKAAEDADLMYRCLCAGIPVVYEPDLVVSHDHGRTGRDAMLTIQRAYSIGMGAMAAKYLLQGDRRPVKELYWDYRSTLKSWRAGGDGALALTKLAALIGMCQYGAQRVAARRGLRPS